MIVFLILLAGLSIARGRRTHTRSDAAPSILWRITPVQSALFIWSLPAYEIYDTCRTNQITSRCPLVFTLWLTWSQSLVLYTLPANITGLCDLDHSPCFLIVLTMGHKW